MPNLNKHINSQLMWLFITTLMVIFSVSKQTIRELISSDYTANCLVKSVETITFTELSDGHHSGTQNQHNETNEDTIVDFEEEIDDSNPTVVYPSKEHHHAVVASSISPYQEQNNLLFHPEASTPPPKA